MRLWKGNMTRTAPDTRTHPYRSDLAARTLEGRVPAEQFVSGQKYGVTAPILDLFTSPSATGIGSQLLHGEAFTVYDVDLASDLAWGQCGTDGYVGYASLAGLGRYCAATRQVRTPLALVFSAPSIKAPILRTLPFLSGVDVTGREGSFLTLAGAGYIHERHLAEVAGDMVSYAEQFIGTPYLWGGRSYLGLDCSALVQLSAAASGIDCPRDSDMQAEELGAPIDLEDGLERGDLVFWKGHVGMMVDRNTLLHANAYHMGTVAEPFLPAKDRIEAQGDGPVTGIRRL